MSKTGPHRLEVVCLAEIVGHVDWLQRGEQQRVGLVRELTGAAQTSCAARGGRAVRQLENSMLWSFESVDGAVSAALATVTSFMASATAVASGASLRVGVHVGDIEESSDGAIHGDTVEAVLRLTPMAEAGSVVLTEVAYRLLRDRSAVSPEDVGRIELDGLPGPVRLYEIMPRPRPGTCDVRDALRRVLAPLQLLGQVSQGTAGDVYLARDAKLHRTLAVRVVRSELTWRGMTRSRLLSHARVIASLAHPNVIGIHSVGTLPDGALYFLTDHVTGGSLAERLSRTRMSCSEGRRLLGDLGAGLEAAHAQGVVHGSLQLSSVLQDGESRRALISDWAQPTPDANSLTDPGARGVRISDHGSPRFLSPEQLAGDAPGPASDVYAAGLIVFEAITGQSPFAGDSPRDLLLARLSSQPRRLRVIDPAADAELDEAIAACLSTAPQDRPVAGALARRFAVGVGSILEWPAPGMEGLIGRGWRPVTDWFAGTQLWLLAVMVWVGWVPFDPSGAESWAVGPVACISLLAGAGLLLARASLGLAPLGALSLRVRRMGYTTATLFDALADLDGSSGMLLAGTHRYARRPARRRRTIILLRRMALLAAALVSALTMFVGVGLSEGWVSYASAFAWWLSAPVLVLFVRSRVWERLMVGGRSRALSGVNDQSLVDGWYRTLAMIGGGLERRLEVDYGPIVLPLALAAVVIAMAMAGIALGIGMGVFGGSYDYLLEAVRSLTLRG